ncbi:TRAP transporter substrate-binding protein [Azospirillum sp. INR13]|uniref:TRAP transporter substrate-binding protein n=1 Tax=Azospirillum sp. INR13 TaxID=2596919 RepID=UPI001892431A|nr:TRAP transporter substrate-binding protein [Azospirillum sp. INR13]MBF5095222.1 TRAP transporter substrate-binding protein [Azospirillum sp. INR13]
MKSIVKLLASTAVALIAGMTVAQAQQVTLRSAEVHPDGYPTVEAVKYMGEIVNRETKGRMGIKVFPSGQLGDEKDTIQQTQFGVIDMNRISMAPLNNIIPATRVAALPFLFRSVDHMHKVMDGPIGDEILASFEQHGLIGLAFYDSGARSFYNSKRPVKSMADLKGMKLRVQQSDLFIDTVKAMGGNPTPMPYGEVYSGLQTGVVDGAENNWPSYQSSHHYEVAKYISLTEHAMVPEALVMSKRSYDKLSKEDQQIIRKAAKESVLKMRELWTAKEKESEAIVVKAGVEVTKLSKDEFEKAVEPVYAKHVTDAKMKDLVARIRAVQ